MEYNNKRKYTETITQNNTLKKQKLDDCFEASIHLHFSNKPIMSFIMDLDKLYFIQNNTSDIYNDICKAIPEELIGINDMCIDSIEYIEDKYAVLNITCYSV